MTNDELHPPELTNPFRVCHAGCKEPEFVEKLPSVRYWPPISWPGQPTIEGHGLSAQFVADQAARRGMADVMEDFEMTKADVMVCLWWAGQYGRRRHRKEWGEWSDEAWKHLWSSCVNVPLPPGVPS